MPTVVYDDGCHLAAFLRNHVDHDIRRTTAMDILEQTPISVDKMHFKNHVGDFCRKNMDPNKNRCESRLRWMLFLDSISNEQHAFSVGQCQHSGG